MNLQAYSLVFTLLLCLPMAAQDTSMTLADLGRSGNDYLHSCEATTHNPSYSVEACNAAPMSKALWRD